MAIFDKAAEESLVLYEVEQFFKKRLAKDWNLRGRDRKRVLKFVAALSPAAIATLRKIFLSSKSFLQHYAFSDLFLFPLSDIEHRLKFQKPIRKRKISIEEEFIKVQQENNKDESDFTSEGRKQFDLFVKEKVVPNLDRICSDVYGNRLTVTALDKREAEQTRKAVDFAYTKAKRDKSSNKKVKTVSRTYAREGVNKYLPHLNGTARLKKIDNVRKSATQKLSPK